MRKEWKGREKRKEGKKEGKVGVIHCLIKQWFHRNYWKRREGGRTHLLKARYSPGTQHQLIRIK